MRYKDQIHSSGRQLCLQENMGAVLLDRTGASTVTLSGKKVKGLEGGHCRKKPRARALTPICCVSWREAGLSLHLCLM